MLCKPWWVSSISAIFVLCDFCETLSTVLQKQLHLLYCCRQRIAGSSSQSAETKDDYSSFVHALAGYWQESDMKLLFYVLSISAHTDTPHAHVHTTHLHTPCAHTTHTPRAHTMHTHTPRTHHTHITYKPHTPAWLAFSKLSLVLVFFKYWIINCDHCDLFYKFTMSLMSTSFICIYVLYHKLLHPSVS